METTTESQQAKRLNCLFSILNQWFYQPDPLLIRTTLATVAALSLERKPLWLMLVGVPSTGKTEIHFPIARAYPSNFETSDLTIPGLISMEKGTKGKGLLERAGVKPLWLIKDFSSILEMDERTRNKLFAVMRELFDGKWKRDAGTGGESWVGRINVIAAATPAIELYHHAQTALGDRFITLRTHPSKPCQELREKAEAQQAAQDRVRVQVQSIAYDIFRHGLTQPTISDRWLDVAWNCASLAAAARCEVQRGKYSQEITRVGQTEGPIRLYQSFTSLMVGDAAVHGQAEVDARQHDLVLRAAFDTAPVHRGRVLRTIPPDAPITQTDALDLTGERWQTSFLRAVEELQTLNLITSKLDGAKLYLQWTEEFGTIRQAMSKKP